MNLAARKAKLENLEQMMTAQASAAYRMYRDDNFNLLLTFNDGKEIKLPLNVNLRPYQLDVQRKLYHEGIKRFFLVRPRRAGKEVESWSMIIQSAIEKPGLYLMIYPTNVRARQVLWNGAITLPDGSSLKFLDMIPKGLIIGKPNDTLMTIKLANGAVIQVLGSTDANSLRGANPLGVVFSEYAFCDPEARRVVMPALKQNGGWLILQTTFFGRNHAYQYMELCRGNKRWYCRVDSVETLVDESGNRYVTDAMIQEDREDGMSESMIRQEYYSTIELDESKIYFALEMTAVKATNRLVKRLIYPGKAAYVGMDLGISDSATNAIFQLDENNHPVIIYYFENNNKKYDYYFRECDRWCVQNNVVLKKFFAPHDGANRDKGTEKNIIDYAREAGYVCEIVERPKSHVNAIQLIRQWINKSRFDLDNTKRLIECLENYAKLYDEKYSVYREEPAHTWASHGVKAFQTMAIAMENQLVFNANTNIIYYNKN